MNRYDRLWELNDSAQRKFLRHFRWLGSLALPVPTHNSVRLLRRVFDPHAPARHRALDLGLGEPRLRV